jgi:hypothetical protein
MLKIILASFFLLISLFASAQPSMSLGTDGRGQVLHFPYYSVSGGFDTYVSITNTKADTKAVRVRFLESKKGKSVLEFNLFLPPFDVWTAALTKSKASEIATLVTRDTSCTSPVIPAAGVDFRTFQFVERDASGVVIDSSSARTMQGFIEVIEMGVVETKAIVDAVVHVSGVPPNCSAVNFSGTQFDAQTGALLPTAEVKFTPPSGGMSGNALLLNVAGGVSYGYEAVAIENVFLSAHFFSPIAEKPSLTDAQKKVVLVDNGYAYSAEFSTGIDAVSALFQRAALSNDWITDPLIAAGTDWVVTFPTKREYVGACGTESRAPFTSTGFCGNGSIETIVARIYDREEQTSAKIDLFQLSPRPRSTLESMSGVYTYARTNVFGVSETQPLTFNPPVGTSGWATFSFDNSPKRLITSKTKAKKDGVECGVLSLKGLPVIGFAAQR